MADEVLQRRLNVECCYLHQTKKVESAGSFWLIDEENCRYLRMPKHEGPRENGWGAADQGALADLTWHPFIDWRKSDDPVFGRRLMIHTHDDPTTGKPMYVVAPIHQEADHG